MIGALILGGAKCVMEDAKAALELFEPDAVLAVNDMIALWPGRVDYIVSVHPNLLVDWTEQRKKKGYPMGFRVWAPKNKRVGVRIPKIDRDFPDVWDGSSGLYAVHVLLCNGFERVVLAGVPVQFEAGCINRPGTWGNVKFWADLHQAAWRNNQQEIAPYVRSMSGWTAELLGKPDKEWFNA